MRLPLSSTINGMEIIHEGNVNEYCNKLTKFKSTNNSGSNQKYQLILQSKLLKNDLGYSKIFDLNIYNNGSSNSEYNTSLNVYIKFGIKTSGELISTGVIIDDINPQTHSNGIDLRMLVKEDSKSYTLYLYCKTYESATAYLVKPNWIKNDVDLKDIKNGGDLIRVDEFEDYCSTMIVNEKILSTKMFNSVTTDTLRVNEKLNVGEFNCSFIPSAVGSTNGKDIGKIDKPVRAVYISNLLRLPSQSTAGRPTVNDIIPVSNYCVIFDMSLKKPIFYCDGKWFDFMGNEV